jgi:hypothetical protein
MTKNMTRKGLALGAASALLISGFSALPASSAGLADTSFVRLAPTTGTEYGMVAEDGTTFSLTANEAATVSDGNLKFLVTDPAGTIVPAAGTTGAVTNTVTDASLKAAVAATGLITVAVTAPDGEYIFYADANLTNDGTNDIVMAPAKQLMLGHVQDGHMTFKSVNSIAASTPGAAILEADNAVTLTMVRSSNQGQVSSDAVALDLDGSDMDGARVTVTTADPGAVALTLDGMTGLTAGSYVFYSKTAVILDIANDGGTDTTVLDAFTPVEATLSAGAVLSFTAKGATNVNLVDMADAADHDLVFIPGTAADFITNARNSVDNTYVVDSAVSDPATNETIVLANDGLLSRSVTVQAFMDVNTNNVIDSTEYASPVRTVTWTKVSELVTGVSMSPVAGDSKLTATVTTAPVLNGEQQIAYNGDWLNVGFTRQDDTTVLYADDTTPVSVWSDTAKTFTVHVDTDADGADDGSSTVNGNSTGGWADLAGALEADGDGSGKLDIDKIVVVGGLGGQVTVTTAAAHNYRVGDKLNVVINGAAEDDKAASADEDGVVITSVPSTTSFTYNVLATTTAVAGTADDDSAELNADTSISVVTFAAGVGVTDRVFAGTYSAQVYVVANASGSKLTVGTIAAATASASLATTGSASVTGNTVTTDTANDQTIKVGTATVPMTLTALDAAGAALGAGRTVVVTTEAPVDGGVTSGTFLVNGAASATLTTDANGQVTFNVTTNDTTATAQTRVSALVENLVTVGMDLHWDAQAYTLVDYGTTAGIIGTDAAIARTILVGGSYSLNLAVEDQWFQAAASDTYRVIASGSGVTEAIQSLVAGRAVVAVRDAGLTAVNGNFVSSVVLQKLTGGVWGAASTHAVTTTLKAAPTVNIGADGSTTYAPGANVSDLSDLVAAKALVEIDQRSSTTATPVYTNAVTIQGNTVDGVTSAAVANVYVTISGPSNILFSNDKVAARGSLTLLTDGNGEFEVNLYSTSAQTNTVITVTAMGSSKTTKVSFTGVGVGEGTSLVVTMPAAVKPATTFQVKAMLTDVYGNAVNAAAGSIKVTYTGPGIVYGTLPTTTDSTGGFQFSVLLGSNDTGTVSVTVSYDQNGDTDYVDAKDLTATGTTAITATGVAASETKVNVGSFKGYVALYAKGYEGQKMSAIVAGKWIVVASLASDFERVVRFTGAGYTITTKIYIDGVMIGTEFTTVTK